MSVPKERTRNGVRQRLCFACGAWKDRLTGYYQRGDRPDGATCIECVRTRKRARYQEMLDHERSLRRARYQRYRRRVRTGAQLEQRDRARSVRMVPSSLVRAWLSVLYAEYEGSKQLVAEELGVPERTIYRIERETNKVRFDIAERIALRADRYDELSPFIAPHGQEGWSKYNDACSRCGTWRRPHYAKGMCARCYRSNLYHERIGVSPPPESVDERWARRHIACVRCRSRRYKHGARGLCESCYSHYGTVASQRGVSLRELLDELGYAISYPQSQTYNGRRGS